MYADPPTQPEQQGGGGDGFAYLSGLDNNPLVCPLGLYAEQLSGTSFTTPRHRNLRTWMYRIKSSVTHDPFHPRDPPNPRLLADFHDPSAAVATPTQLRWSPADMSSHDADLDFVDGLYTITICSSTTMTWTLPPTLPGSRSTSWMPIAACSTRTSPGAARSCAPSPPMASQSSTSSLRVSDFDDIICAVACLPE